MIGNKLLRAHNDSKNINSLIIDIKLCSSEEMHSLNNGHMIKAVYQVWGIF